MPGVAPPQVLKQVVLSSLHAPFNTNVVWSRILGMSRGQRW